MKRRWYLEMKALKKAAACIRGALPEKYAPGAPDIRVEGLRDVYVEGHRGLKSYSSERILIRTAGQTLSVDGAGLSVSGVTMEEIHIRGSIRRVGTED